MIRTGPPLLSLLVAMALAAAPATVDAQERETLGLGRVLTNDVIGDGQDRWRSGGYQGSLFRGPGWTGTLPTTPFTIMEYRVRGEVIAPANTTRPDPTDRLYAGTWWIGAHTHFDFAGFDVSAGADLAITGEQSGIRSIQTWVHSTASLPSIRVENFQVDDGVYLHGTLEIGRQIDIAGANLRPFVEIQAGVETLARVGADLTFGSLGQGGLLMRDQVTGQRLGGVNGDVGGWSFLLGGDYSYVDSSVFLPEDRGYTVEDFRTRLRAGVNFGFGDSNLFYGVTYLSEEFVGQPEGQMVGSISLNIRF